MKTWSNRIIFRCLHCLWNLLLYLTRWLYNLGDKIFSPFLCILIMLSLLLNLLSFCRHPFLKLIFFCWSNSWTHMFNLILMLFNSHLYYLFSYFHLLLKILRETILKQILDWRFRKIKTLFFKDAWMRIFMFCQFSKIKQRNLVFFFNRLFLRRRFDVYFWKNYFVLGKDVISKSFLNNKCSWMKSQ